MKIDKPPFTLYAFRMVPDTQFVVHINTSDAAWNVFNALRAKGFSIAVHFCGANVTSKFVQRAESELQVNEESDDHVE